MLETVADEAQATKRALLHRVDALQLPTNPLEAIISRLGGPGAVAEMTGRKARLERQADGRVRAVERCKGRGAAAAEALASVNIAEKQCAPARCLCVLYDPPLGSRALAPCNRGGRCGAVRATCLQRAHPTPSIQPVTTGAECRAFLNGTKRVAIISDAASTGISLHAERRQMNRQRRAHITVELPWSAEKAVQQFGRTHRANQVHAPAYAMVFTPVRPRPCPQCESLQ